MLKRFYGFSRRPSSAMQSNGRGLGIWLLLAVSFLSGSVLRLALSAESIEFVPVDPSHESLLMSFLESLFVPALLFLASTSLLGVCAAPMCLAFLGYWITGASFSVFFRYPDCGWMFVFASVGLSALISLPCIFYLGADAIRSSFLLLQNTPRISRISGPVLFLKHFLLFLPLFLASSAVDTAFMPYLIGLMID